jgi:tetratricopeptide (TPR) repeat protein
MTRDEFLAALLAAPDSSTRRAQIDEHAEFLQTDSVYALKDRADQLEQDDARTALTIGLVADELAGRLQEDESRAVAAWIQANAYDYLAENENAVRCYQRAAQLFIAAGKPLEAARTSIGFMFTLMAGGQFDEAQSLAQSARAVFVEHGDVLSQAKIDMNLGNLHYQQGQYAAALEDYRRATAAFHDLGEAFYEAMNQINQATALTALDDFHEAERLHALAGPVFAAAEMPTVAASVEHDRAILQYARGEYAGALRTFERARDIFAAGDNPPNLAQTNLEESDIYLDLNLPEDALRLAQQAGAAFADLEMPLELARSQANQAVALARLGRREHAARLLEQAREAFTAQGNQAWTAHTGLQRAEILGQDGQHEPARSLAIQAAEAYASLGMKTKQAYARIVAAGQWLAEGQRDQARTEIRSAREALEGLSAPWIEQRIEFQLGRASEADGQIPEAIAHYRAAAEKTEQMASALSAEEHRTAYVADKLAPYEALVSLLGPADPAAAFQWAEQARSRALIDMLAAGVHPRLPAGDETDARRLERLQALREELNWLYTRLTRGVAPGESGAPAAGPETWAKLQEREQEATALWRDLQARHAEGMSLLHVAPISAGQVQAGLPERTALVEYFVARGQVTAFVVTRKTVHFHPALAPIDRLLPLLEQLAFQFSKFQYGPAYYQRHRAVLLHDTQEVLSQLGQALLAPLRPELDAVDALIIIPHGPLHPLPFQALRVGERYLIESHAVSYAPSAAVRQYCMERPAQEQPGKPLLVGVPDELTVHVEDEIRSLAALFGGAETLLGEQATFERVRRAAPSCGIFHLAAHGLFRPEAPLLSSIRLADRWLAVQDVYDLELRASLVTLSACETGLGHDAGGDDMVGLVRGFLYAGAGSLLVSLWMVDDESMTKLVTDFYRQWLAGAPKAAALRQAQLDLLASHEHPYYWAPLVLVGNEK